MEPTFKETNVKNGKRKNAYRAKLMTADILA